MHRFTVRAWACGLFVMWTASSQAQAQAQAPAWTSTEINVLAGTSSVWFADFNNRGELIGQAYGSGVSGSFFYSAGQMSLIPALPGSSSSADAMHLNDLGQVIGHQYGAGGFLYQNGQTRSLTVDGQPAVSALAINNRGDVLTSRYVYNNGRVRGYLDPSFVPASINEQGHVAGTISTAGGRQVAIDTGSSLRSFGPVATDVAVRDIDEAGRVAGSINRTATVFDAQGQAISIGRLGGLDSSADNITRWGDVIGEANYSVSADKYPTNHIFLWRDGAVHDITADFNFDGRSAYSAFVIDSNEIGQMLVQAWFRMDEWLVNQVYLWNHGEVTDLSSLIRSAGGPYLGLAHGAHGSPILNDVGQIAAHAWTASETVVPIILTPVPEPQMLALLGAGLLALGVLQRRRRGLASPRTDRPGLPQPTCAAA
ncbi:PEP-CTERM sorting domain-containing protein [Methylibium rhizosphaerae]|uniref:PEP-CTERM sorting domain-containing protein n=1 Tax=Methylibium rhizosphaerae TaxID=2570323 RepID=UPI00112DFC38|nr:PEP-CTERM sorting domain-containing protein [Methylibium rhizosphaerae]